MTTRTQNKNPERLNISVTNAVKHFKPPELLTVSEWADKYRRLSPENSAEAGPWRTSRTPYLKEIMDAFTDPKIRKLTLAAASQVAKTEMMLNMVGYAIDNDPGSMMFILPTVIVAKEFSKRRIAPMIRDCKQIKEKISDAKTRDGNNTVLQKTFPGGMLTITGSNSPASLASTPARYIFGDERDRWAVSAGTEGDPWALAEARTTTFYNAKLVEVSTPTIKGSSPIEASFEEGTRERWCHQCPECGSWHNIVFSNIIFDHEVRPLKRKKDFVVKGVWWACPSCGNQATQEVMRKQPAKWIAENPDAYEKGVRSFWLNAFSSPWVSWEKIIYKFLEAKDDPGKLQVVYNTVLGECWEDRGNVEDEETLLKRREEYAAEVPEGAFILTCGVDTQNNRLEYEVVGHGHFGETWGIKKGIIMGKPDDEDTWKQLDDVIDHTYSHESGKKLTISATFVDSGGHYTQEVYKACRERQSKKVFAIKGKGGDGIPYTAPPTQVPIRENKQVKCWLYILGVDAGKAAIMNAIKVQDAGAKYCHFPKGESRGYDFNFFNGLLSEKLVLSKTRSGNKWTWEKLAGHNRNEALDCRNYAMAAFRVLNVDMEAYERRFKGQQEQQQKQPITAKPSKPKKSKKIFDDW